jgi:hypothetical protein
VSSSIFSLSLQGTTDNLGLPLAYGFPFLFFSFVLSLAKAGITTILNSRTAVLAAANPVFGTYDDQRTPFENIEFQSTILSRYLLRSRVP